jgi:hypothetical protein
MEYVSGGSLEQELMRRRAILAPTEAAQLVAILARAVQAAHAAGIVHRDLKPGNVLMAPALEGNAGTILAGFPKISDFGLARLADDEQGQTTTGLVLGTPQYMAPEQALGRTAEMGPPADVWALGVILYRCLAGQVPFAGDSMLQTLDLVRSAAPAPPRRHVPGVPAELEALCLRCLDKEPARRPTAGELAGALERFASQSTDSPGAAWTPPPAVGAGPDDPTRALPGALPAVPPVHLGRRRSWRLAAVVCLGVAVLALAGLGAWGVFGPGREGGKKESGDRGEEPVVLAPLQVKELRVLHYATRPGEESEFMGRLGDRSDKAHFNDAVQIQVDLSAPGYAYLLGFNPDGTEQLLWPVGIDKRSNPRVAPPLVTRLVYPARSGKWLFLNDEPKGGLQAFVVVASRRPLPSYQEWLRRRGKAAWRRLPPGKGVWAGDPEGTYALKVVMAVGRVRAQEAALPDAPPLDALCRSLRGAPAQTVEAVAFPVLPRQE